jgi:hypothetical protein
MTIMPFSSTGEETGTIRALVIAQTAGSSVRADGERARNAARRSVAAAALRLARPFGDRKRETLMQIPPCDFGDFGEKPEATAVKRNSDLRSPVWLAFMCANRS